MAPFVPDIISNELNLIVALVIGFFFGFVLEQAGFSSSRRLAGVFYGYDFTVLRVFFTAAVTAALGVAILGDLGLLDTDAIFINPTWLLPTIVGGAIMGLGFIIGGYCPGTSVCAAAIGKVDAMFFVGGGILGVFGFGEVYPLIKDFNDSSSLGPVKVYDSIGIDAGTFVMLLSAIAVGAFAITTMIERRVDPENAPSRTFNRRRHILAGTATLAIALTVMLLPDRTTRLLALSRNVEYIRSHPSPILEVDELAFRIVDKEPNLRIVDIRSAKEFSERSLPSAVRMPVEDFSRKAAAEVFGQRKIKKVVVGADEMQEQAAVSILAGLGYENIVALRGGFDAFRKTILDGSPQGRDGAIPGDVVLFRTQARTAILAMIEAAKAGPAKEVKAEKKIQGGC